MKLADFFKAPMEGKTSLARVFWLYSVLGSLLFGSIELFLNPENLLVMRLYSILGILFTVYVTVATYRCAYNCRSPMIARLARAGAIATLVLLPVLTYFDLTGSLSVADLMGGQLP